jgi:uncharacterized protein YjiS (DUF1127 family)
MAILTQLSRSWQRTQARRRDIAQVVRELDMYSDRELAELGLGRGDILDVARGTYRRG